MENANICLLCNKHFKGNRIKKKKVSEYKHDKSSYSKTISGIFCREMKVLKCIQCNPKYNKIIKHIEECIDWYIHLLHHKSNWTHFKEFCKCLRNSDRTGKLNNIHRECNSNRCKKYSNRHWCINDSSYFIGRFLLLCKVSDLAFSVFIGKEFVDKVGSRCKRYESYNWSYNMIELDEIPCFIPDIENHEVHDSFGKDKYSRYLKHLFSWTCLSENREKHHKYPHSTRIESVDKSKESCEEWKWIFTKIYHSEKWEFDIESRRLNFAWNVSRTSTSSLSFTEILGWCFK